MADQEYYKDLAVFPFRNQATFRKWLSKNFEQDEGIWVKFAKKNSGIESINYEESREEALIFGWIDGQIKSLDETWYIRKFTRRRRRSQWSKINRDIVETLIRENRMKPSGLAEVVAAQKDGRWDAAYSSPATAKTPAELKALLSEDTEARQFYESLSPTGRFAFISRIENAKRPATREKHIRKAFEMCQKGQTY